MFSKHYNFSLWNSSISSGSCTQLLYKVLCEIQTSLLIGCDLSKHRYSLGFNYVLNLISISGLLLGYANSGGPDLWRKAEVVWYLWTLTPIFTFLLSNIRFRWSAI